MRVRLRCVPCLISSVCVLLLFRSLCPTVLTASVWERRAAAALRTPQRTSAHLTPHPLCVLSATRQSTHATLR